MKLTVRLTILFLIIALIPLIFTSYFAYTNSRLRIEESSLSRLESINLLKAAEFQRWVDNESQSLRELARRPLIKQYTSILTTREGLYAPSQLQYARSAIYDNHFEPTLFEEGGFTELFLLHPDRGIILASTKQENVSKFRDHEPYFVQGKQETFVQNAYYALDQGKPIMTIATPVIDINGRLIAVLAGHVDLNEMTSIMQQGQDTDATIETYIINKFNFFITESRFNQDTALTQAAYSPGIEICLQQKKGNGFYNDYRGIPIIGVYRWLPENELCILTEVDQAEAFAPIMQMRNTFLAISVFVAGMITLFGLFFANTITNPILKLVQGTEEIARGNLDYRIQLRSKDEIGQLASTFNDMAASRQKAENALRDYHTNLEQTVADRTASLQMSEERLSRVIEASNTGIWDWNIQAHEVYYSPRWKSLLGYEDDEIDNAFEEWENRLHPDDKQRMLDAVADFLEHPVGNFDQEFRMQHKNGSYRWIANRSAVLLDEAGIPYRMFGSHLDITEKKRADDALAQKAAALTQSNEELKMFAYIASHDLQEPLRMVTNYLQLLSKRYQDKLDSEAQEFIDFAVDGAKRMHQLINDLLTYSRVGTHNKPHTLVNCQDILKNTLRLMQFTIEDHNAVITCSQMPIVLADESQMSQLFQNLISNAIKFRNESPKVHIKAEQQDDNWLFSVQDNGIGIDPQSASRIFDVFQRLHTRDAYPGTGIGLAICKKIVERHHGKIWVQSQPGEGATFYFTLPQSNGDINLR